MITRLFVLPDGSVQGVYTDLVPELIRPDSLQVRRASTVEWSPATLQWVSVRDGVLLCAHARREECVRMEHQLLEDAWTT